MPIFQLPASRPKQEIYHVSMAALLCFCPHLLKPEIILPQYKHLYCISIRFKTSWYNMMMSVTKVIISKGFDDDDCVTARQHGAARSCLEGVLSHSLLPLSGLLNICQVAMLNICQLLNCKYLFSKIFRCIVSIYFSLHPLPGEHIQIPETANIFKEFKYISIQCF